MKKIEVYGDFNWLKVPLDIGSLSYDNVRGFDHFSFMFSEAWLKKHSSLFLDRELTCVMDAQLPGRHRGFFQCFEDHFPDKWGRCLLQLQEMQLAKSENRAAKHLTCLDYLTLIDDFSRMGAFRFKFNEDNNNFNLTSNSGIFKLSDLSLLLESSLLFERTLKCDGCPNYEQLFPIIKAGHSLGGARPKASLLNGNKLCVAKFPSINDKYDVELWEHLCLELAKQSGISVANTYIVKAKNSHHSLVSERFDRTNNGKRIHFCSALSLLGVGNEDPEIAICGYPTIADFIIQHCCNTTKNLEELYRRAAFSICVCNTDDHLRNHGFLLTPAGWTLSPMYDVNPTLKRHQSLLIDNNSNDPDLEMLQNDCKLYYLKKLDAERIINQVVSSIKNWKEIALRLKANRNEIELFEPVFNRFIK